jgi:hypothetical protein
MVVGLIIYGGFRYVISRGSPDETKKAQDIILKALVGLGNRRSMLEKVILTFHKINADIPKISGGELLKNGLNVAYSLVGAIAVIVVIYAGYQYMTSNGDSGKAQTAMKTILFAVVGIVVVASAFVITNFVVGRV